MGADDRQHGERERDVRGGRDRPPRQRTGRTSVHGDVDRDVDQRRERHPTDGGRHRQDRTPDLAQVSGDELPFELQPGDEEEDRQQPVRCPLRQREVQMQRRRPDPQFGERRVGAPPGGVRPHQRHHRGHRQQHTADGLGPQNLTDPPSLGHDPRPNNGVRRPFTRRSELSANGRSANEVRTACGS